jgi:hypothetical protein
MAGEFCLGLRSWQNQPEAHLAILGQQFAEPLKRRCCALVEGGGGRQIEHDRIV